MWPGGGKASDACTPVPTLPGACTSRRTGYLVPGPRHNRTEGQKKGAAPSCCLLAGSTIRDGDEDLDLTWTWATPSRQTSSQSQSNTIFYMHVYMWCVCVCVGGRLCACVLCTHNTPMLQQLQ